MRLLKHLAAAAGLAVLATGAAAQYPERPVTILVPFNPGGSTDIIGRIVADYLSEELGAPVVVENRGGGGGTIGTAVVAEAEPDGYTLLLSTAGTLSINPNLREVDYDPVADFAPIGLAVETPVLVTIHSDVDAENLQEFVDLASAEPGRFNFASAGNGSTSHLAGALFNKLTGAEMVHIPYPGSGPAMNDVLAGRVEFFANNMPPFIPHIESGALRPLAVASAERSGLLPDVPTAAEAGLEGYEISGWFGLSAPAGTPEEVLDTLYEAMSGIDEDEDVRERLANVGSEPKAFGSREEFGQYIEDQLATWAEVVETSGAEVQ